MGYFHRDTYANLKSMVDRWDDNKLIAPRMRIIRRALQAHCDKDYLLSVPALIPQIEGILNDVAHSNQMTAKLGKIEKVYAEVIGPVDSYDISRWAVASTLKYILANNLYPFTLFEAELKKPIKKRVTTRHTILHGADLNYDKPSTSLRPFLIIDAISVLNV